MPDDDGLPEEQGGDASTASERSDERARVAVRVMGSALSTSARQSGTRRTRVVQRRKCGQIPDRLLPAFQCAVIAHGLTCVCRVKARVTYARSNLTL